MRLNDSSKAVFIHILFLIFCHYSLKLIRFYVPDISGADVYFPRKYINNNTLNDVEVNSYRSHVSQEILEHVDWTKEIDNNLEIRVIAADRRRGYLNQVLAFLLDSYAFSKNRPKILICNVESATFQELAPFKDKLEIVQLNSPPINASLKAGSRAIAKETMDYRACLDIPTNSRFVLLLEDDALVVPLFSSLMTSLIGQLDQRSKVDYVKMYHPTALRKLPSIPFTVLFALLLVVFLQLFIRRKFEPWLLLLSCLVLYLDVRSYKSIFLADIRYALTSSVYMSLPESCCTPAVLFRTSSKERIVKYFSEQLSYQGHAKDHILDESPFIGRQTDFNLVVHIGSFSSVRKMTVRLGEVEAMLKNYKKPWWQYFT